MKDPRVARRGRYALALGAISLFFMPPLALLAGLRYRKSQVELVVVAALALSLAMAAIGYGIAALAGRKGAARTSPIVGIVIAVAGLMASAAAALLGVFMHFRS